MSRRPISFDEIDVSRFVVQWDGKRWLVLLGQMPLFVETNWLLAIEAAAKRANVLAIDDYESSVTVFNKDGRMVFRGSSQGVLKWCSSQSIR